MFGSMRSQRTSLVPLFKHGDLVTTVKMQVDETFDSQGAVHSGGNSLERISLLIFMRSSFLHIASLSRSRYKEHYLNRSTKVEVVFT